MLVEGPEKFGQVSYLGTMPVAGHEGLCDVLKASHDDVDCHLIFDAGNGGLVALEMFPEADRDPCELRFYDYRDFNGHWLPGRIEVRHGDGYSASFECKQYEFKEGDQ
jgi:hypothetical protein